MDDEPAADEPSAPTTSPVLEYVDAAKELVRRADDPVFERDLHDLLERELGGTPVGTEAFGRLEQRLVNLFGDDDPGPSMAYFLMSSLSLPSENEELPELLEQLDDASRAALLRLLRRARARFGHAARGAAIANGQHPDDWSNLLGQAYLIQTPMTPVDEGGERTVIERIEMELTITLFSGHEYKLRGPASSYVSMMDYITRQLYDAPATRDPIVDPEALSALIEQVAKLQDRVLAEARGDEDDESQEGRAGVWAKAPT